MPVGIVLLVVAIILGVFQSRQGAPSARRAERMEKRDPGDPLPAAHEGQAHMTPDKI